MIARLSSCLGPAALVLLFLFPGAGPAGGQGEGTPAARPFIESIRFRGTHTSWSIDAGDSTRTVRQTRLPLEVGLRPAARLRIRAGIEMRSQSIGGPGSITSTALAGGWLDARCAAGSSWLIGAGGVAPMRDPSITLDESRLVTWLEETGLQLGSTLALDPSLEARVSRSAAWRQVYSFAAGIAAMARLPHPAYRGGVSLDPGDRLRLAAGFEGPLSAWRGSLSASGSVESFSKMDGAGRYREGPRVRIETVLVRPGNHELRCELGTYLQAEGEGGGGWPAPRGGSLWRAGLGLTWGSAWRWTVSAAGWRTRGFGDLLGDSFAVRPGGSVARTFGGHHLEASIAPLFGTAARDQTLRGLDAVLSWGIAR